MITQEINSQTVVITEDTEVIGNDNTIDVQANVIIIVRGDNNQITGSQDVQLPSFHSIGQNNRMFEEGGIGNMIFNGDIKLIVSDSGFSIETIGDSSASATF